MLWWASSFSSAQPDDIPTGTAVTGPSSLEPQALRMEELYGGTLEDGSESSEGAKTL